MAGDLLLWNIQVDFCLLEGGKMRSASEIIYLML